VKANEFSCTLETSDEIERGVGEVPDTFAAAAAARALVSGGEGETF